MQSDLQNKDANENLATNSGNVSILLPAYNEAEGIGLILKKLCEEPALASAEIIVIDDGSSDNTASVVKQFPRVELIRHTVNKGYGAALTTGILNASRNYVIWMDSDGQHRVQDVIKVAKCLLSENLDFCVGVRTKESDQVTSRLFGKWILRLVVRLAAGRTVTDFNSGLRGFRRSLISKYVHLIPKGFGASTTTTLIMLERNYNYRDVPILVLRRVGKSSVRQVRDGVRTLLLILHIFLLFKPLHFFGTIGGVLTVVGSAYSLWVSLIEGGGIPVLGAVILLSGLQTLFTGLVVDQISAMRRERFE